MHRLEVVRRQRRARVVLVGCACDVVLGASALGGRGLVVGGGGVCQPRRRHGARAPPVTEARRTSAASFRPSSAEAERDLAGEVEADLAGADSGRLELLAVQAVEGELAGGGAAEGSPRRAAGSSARPLSAKAQRSAVVLVDPSPPSAVTSTYSRVAPCCRRRSRPTSDRARRRGRPAARRRPSGASVVASASKLPRRSPCSSEGAVARTAKAGTTSLPLARTV